MKISLPENFLRSTAGVCLTLLLGLVASPSQARASCGARFDHLQGGGLGIERLDRFAAAHGQWGPETAIPVEAPRRPRPCSGPSCSKLPAIPAPPSVAEARYVEVWAIFGSMLGGRTVASTRITPEDRDLHAIHVGPSIFHPPRSSSRLAV
ncbi:hypothetical protein [Singulisphaera sp. PoT]|uniref:hypothetical protein n=1 Tax=Singulisphaera sp. PoT TaxID=3411797 RepID=UPI003BF4A961